ncbi:MAG TPA: polyprenol phosphomannose-dependent alpha 1,6 mannosyltransferase MptB [Thermomicrobiales bacterium]|nr:polyprenol phosphomannose-dependent alpha 1,6 mannosyltransferase MptB [Thermomicrobiales bacterium]
MSDEGAEGGGRKTDEEDRAAVRRLPSAVSVLPDCPTARLPDSRPGRAALAGVLALGAAAELLYALAFVRPYPLTRYVAQPLLDLGKIGGYDPGAGLRYTVPLALVWACYLGAGFLAWRLRRALPALAFGGAAAFGLTLLWLYPITAADIFNYVLYGLVQHRGANPLAVPPRAVIGQPLLGFSAWPDHPSPYGPVWQWLAYAVTAVTGERLLAGLLAFKGALLACHLANVGLVRRVAADAGMARPWHAALLYAWNPLVLYETAGNGHNDVVMLTLVLLGLVALAGQPAGRWAALVGGTLAALVKYVAALWLPVLLVGVWHAGRGGRRLARAAAGLAAGAALAVALYAPFWDGGAALTGVRRQADLYTTSFGALALLALPDRLPAVAPATLLDACKAAAAACVALAFLWHWRRMRDTREVVDALFDVLLVYLLTGALWFQPWYVVPLAGLAALTGAARRLVALVFALGAMGSYVVYFYVWPALDWTPDRLLIQEIAVAVTYGPVLLVLAGLLLAAFAHPGRRGSRLP